MKAKNELPAVDTPETLVPPPASPPSTTLSPAVEDYLKAIYTLQQQGDRVSTTALCAQLGGLKPGSVSGMLRQLEERGLVIHQLYHGARLTPAGERAPW
jgi:DtxR family transcriptional regulator, Mn-dependent transcriptional regulator